MNVTSKEERKYRKELTAMLEEKNIPAQTDLADILVDMGVYNEIESYENILKTEKAIEFVQTVYKTFGVVRSSQPFYGNRTCWKNSIRIEKLCTL